MIELKELPLVKADEPLSKGIALLLKPSPIVGVLEGNNLIGVLDDRHLSIRAKDASQIKCSSVSIKCHKIKKIGSIEHLIKIFANEHFKALPVVGKDNRPVGYYSRSEILKAIVDKGLLPDVSITDIMSAPIYTIDSNATLGEAKARMKELGVKRLTVLENGRLIGVISSFDLIALKIKPKQRQSMQLVKEVKNIENTKVKELLREPLLIVAKTDRLYDVVTKMYEKNVSYALVVESLEKRKPIGILTARAIFKKVLENIEKPKTKIEISGLKDKNMWAFDEIKDAFMKLAEKINKIKSLDKISITIKEGKSTYRYNVGVYSEGKIEHFHSEDEELLMAAYKVIDIIKARALKEKGRKHLRKPAEEEFE